MAKDHQLRDLLADEKRSEWVEAAACPDAVIAHLGLSQLAGSERQIAWATTIRAVRLATIVAASTIDGDDLRSRADMTDAKWRIDSRNLANTDLLGKARLPTGSMATGDSIKNAAQVA